MPEQRSGKETDPSAIPASARVGSQGRFRKVLTFQELLFLALGASIGSAWLFGSLYGASSAGPASVISWLIGGLLIAIIALTWAEIGGMLPSTGAVVKIPQYAHGYFAGFYVGWAYYLSAVIVPPVEAVAIVTYASAYVPSFMNGGFLTPEGSLVCLGIIALSFILNSYGVRLFARFNTVVTWWKLLIPTLTVLVALFYFYPPNFSAFGGFAPRGITPIFSAVGTAGIIFAYTGFRSAMDYSGEARNPGRDVPRAMLLSVAITIVLYTLLEVAFIGGIRWGASGLRLGDWQDLATSGAYASAPFYHLMSILGISAVASVLIVDSVISPLGTVGVYVGSSARDLFALSEGGHVNRRLSEVNKKYGVPRGPLLVSFVIGVVFVLAFPNWSQLATIGTAATVFTYVVGSTALTTLRKNAPLLKRTFRVPAARIIAPASFSMSGMIVYWTTWPFTGYATVIFLAGLLLFFYSRANGGYPVGDVRRGVWIVIYSIFLASMSYLGSYGVGVIAFPLDFVLVAVLSLGFYYWGIRSSNGTDELKRLVEQEGVEGSLE